MTKPPEETQITVNRNALWVLLFSFLITVLLAGWLYERDTTTKQIIESKITPTIEPIINLPMDKIYDMLYREFEAFVSKLDKVCFDAHTNRIFVRTIGDNEHKAGWYGEYLDNLKYSELDNGTLVLDTDIADVFTSRIAPDITNLTCK